MGLILFILFCVLVLNAFVRATKMQHELQNKSKADFVVEEVVKNCPPHKWRHIEVRDTEGKTVRWRMVCDLCGPLKPMGGPAKLG
jgi:hypothetical protein